MGRPAIADIHVDRLRTDIAMDWLFRVRERGFKDWISPAFPTFYVDEVSGKVAKYGKADAYRDEFTDLAPNGEAQEINQSVTTSTTYTCKPYGARSILDWRLQASDSTYKLVENMVKKLVQKAMIKRDKLVKTAFLATSVWTGSATGADQTGVAAAPSTNQFLQFNDANSDPLDVLGTLRDEMFQKTGYNVNTMVMDLLTFRRITNHPDVRDVLKYSSDQALNRNYLRAKLADHWELENGIWVTGSMENTANSGAASATMTAIQSKSLWMGHLAMNPASGDPGLSPDAYDPSAAYIMSWKMFDQVVSDVDAPQFLSYTETSKKRDVREAMMDLCPFVLDADLGIFLTAAVA